MITEYRISNKVESLMFNGLAEGEMNTILIYTGTGTILHVGREVILDEKGISKKCLSVGISTEQHPQKITKSYVMDESKVEMMISFLDNYKEFIKENSEVNFHD